MTAKTKSKIIICITGASGSVYAKQLLEKTAAILSDQDKLAVVFSSNAEAIWKHEIEEDIALPQKATRYALHDFYAPFASGSSAYDCMVICPASMGIIGRIASGVSDDLITRAADVMLKERKKLIIVPREAPYNLIHLNNMTAITASGGIICPASPSFYAKPETITDMVNTIVERIITLSGFNIDRYQWGTDGK